MNYGSCLMVHRVIAAATPAEHTLTLAPNETPDVRGRERFAIKRVARFHLNAPLARTAPRTIADTPASWTGAIQRESKHRNGVLKDDFAGVHSAVRRVEGCQRLASIASGVRLIGGKLLLHAGD